MCRLQVLGPQLPQALRPVSDRCGLEPSICDGITTQSCLDWRLPATATTATPETPPLTVRLVGYPSTKNPLGVKGIGESGTVPAAAAIIAGIEDALRDPVKLVYSIVNLHWRSVG